MVVVRFKRNYRIYNAGEIAGFLPDEAEQLITDGIAEAFVPAKGKK